MLSDFHTSLYFLRMACTALAARGVLNAARGLTPRGLLEAPLGVPTGVGSMRSRKDSDGGS